ncbi:MAG TPA: hypothetical protein VFK19_11595 [Sphingomicrobium sp.]|nr:hypothetical protein [Sphingomicrobium sp.]
MRATSLILAVAVLVTVGACARRDPVADNAEVAAANMPPTVPPATPSPDGAPPANATAPVTAPAPAAAIPASLQGRWGLTPADCTSTRGDAKGLLVITPGELRFYESRAVPSPGAQTDDNSVSGNFHFTGEGQSWTKFETLERRKDELVRTETDPTASYTYAKC